MMNEKMKGTLKIWPGVSLKNWSQQKRILLEMGILKMLMPVFLLTSVVI